MALMCDGDVKTIVGFRIDELLRKLRRRYKRVRELLEIGSRRLRFRGCAKAILLDRKTSF